MFLLKGSVCMCKKYRFDTATKHVFVAPCCGDVLEVVFRTLPSLKYSRVSGGLALLNSQ